ncbi:MAG: sulfate ABC transporter substrate-binding protein, partial [Rhodoferax sp.]|nr:sulfate ABC transporter substrate-binding protein [Actinomycetota bacterium]
AVIARAFSGITVTVDPLASSLQKDLSDGVTAGLVKKADLKGIYDLRPQNAVLKAKGEPTVSSAGLGQQ